MDKSKKRGKKDRYRYITISSIFLIFILFPLTYAHMEETGALIEKDIGDYLKSTSLNYLIITSIIILVLVLLSIYGREKSESAKAFLFLGITIPTLLSTIYLAGSTVYINQISETQGPVHWHADYEVWNCNEKIDLVKPKGISNRVGSPLFHDHGDNRIHVEGVVIDKRKVDLHSFFETIGGNLETGIMEIPTDKKTLIINDGDSCNGYQGKLQVFLYRIKNPEDVKNWVFEQLKLESFEKYILSPHSNIPPGDCIILEFDSEKEKTEHICETYRIAMERGELTEE
jgi:hypothetical protein